MFNVQPNICPTIVFLIYNKLIYDASGISYKINSIMFYTVSLTLIITLLFKIRDNRILLNANHISVYLNCLSGYF